MISAIVYIMYLGENHGFSLELLMCSTTCTSLARQVMTAAALGLPPELNNPLGIPSPKQPTKLWATWNTGRGMWGCSSLTLALLLYLAFSLTKQWVFEQCSAQRGDIGGTWTKNQPSCTSTESVGREYLRVLVSEEACWYIWSTSWRCSGGTTRTRNCFYLKLIFKSPLSCNSWDGVDVVSVLAMARRGESGKGGKNCLFSAFRLPPQATSVPIEYRQRRLVFICSNY